MSEGTARTSASPNYLITERLRKHPAPVLTVVTQLRGASQQSSPSSTPIYCHCCPNNRPSKENCHAPVPPRSEATKPPPKGRFGGGLTRTAKRLEHKKAGLHRLFCARDGDTTKTIHIKGCRLKCLFICIIVNFIHSPFARIYILFATFCYFFATRHYILNTFVQQISILANYGSKEKLPRR